MSRPDPQVDLVVPVLNEAHVLEKSVETMRAFLGANFPYPWRIVIAENGSEDGTIEVAQKLADTYEDTTCDISEYFDFCSALSAFSSSTVSAMRHSR